MKCMILAAGLGRRMGSLTRTTPKALLRVAGDPLITHQVRRLVAAGHTDMVINYAGHSEEVMETLGNGNSFGASIHYCDEGDQPLETGGGIVNALPHLGSEPFVVVNADVWTNFPFETLQPPVQGLAHLILVANPPHNPRGDFGIVDGRVSPATGPRLTFTGIGVYRPELFYDCPPGRRPTGADTHRGC